MEYGAIDLHARRSQIRIVREDGLVLLERQVETSRGRLGSRVRDARADADSDRKQ